METATDSFICSGFTPSATQLRPLNRFLAATRFIDGLAIPMLMQAEPRLTDTEVIRRFIYTDIAGAIEKVNQFSDIFTYSPLTLTAELDDLHKFYIFYRGLAGGSGDNGVALYSLRRATVGPVDRFFCNFTSGFSTKVVVIPLIASIGLDHQVELDTQNIGRVERDNKGHWTIFFLHHVD